MNETIEQKTWEPMSRDVAEANQRLIEKRRQLESASAKVNPLSKAVGDILNLERFQSLAKTAYSNAEADRIEAQKRQRIHQSKVEELRSSHWNAPLRHLERRKSEYSTNPNGAAWRNQFDSKMKPKLGTGCLLCLIGIRGSGKTQMAVEAMFAATDQLRTAFYTTAMEVFITIKKAYHPSSKFSEDDAISKYTRPGLLVIDEAHERGETDWEDRILTHIIDDRYRAMKDTILIANLEKSECEKSLGRSVVTRLNETGGFIVCDWKSFR